MAKREDDFGDWELLTPEEDANSIIGSSQGLAGSGKTRFWLTGPGPIGVFLFDPGGLKGLRNDVELMGDKRIYVLNMTGDGNIAKLDRTERIAASIELLDNFKREWDRIVKLVKTVIIDKESHLWEIIRYAHNEVDSPQPKEFHELNMLYRGWVSDAENNGVNLGLIRDMHDTWGKIGVKADGKPQLGFTGKFRPDGQKYVPGLVQINLEHRWNEAERHFEVQVLEKCRLGEAKKLIGKVMPELTLPMLGTILFKGTTEEDWS